MPMMGSKLVLDTPEATGIGATYRYTGRVLGLVIDFSEMVTRYVAGREKVWRTIGAARLSVSQAHDHARHLAAVRL